SFAPQGLSTVRGKDIGANVASGTFEWTAAVQVLAAYLLRCAVWGLRNSEHQFGPEWRLLPDFPRLEGRRGTPAASLNYAISKAPKWICEMFGCDVNGEPHLRRLIYRSNADFKRKN